MKMKDSGIGWIEMVPEGWEVRPFKSLYELGKGLPITKEDLVENGMPVVSYGQIHSKSNIGVSLGNELLRYVSSEYLRTHSQCILSLGDIAIADTSEDLEGCGNSVLMNRDEPVFAGYHTIIAKKRNDSNSKFLAYVFLSENWRSQIRSTVHGVKLFSITKQILSQTSFPIPPLSEQQAIANYLDEKCGKIDEQVKLLEKKVEAYKNLKRSVINETVTRGLDKNVKLKDSGVDWIGMVPEGWEVTRFKMVCEELSSGKRPSDDPEEVLSIGGEHIQNGKFSLDVPRYVSRKTYNSSRGKIKIGDILVVKDGATIDKAMYVDVMPEDEMLLNEHVYRVVANKFYFYWIISSKGEKWFRIMNTSTAQESIPQDVMYSLPILCPPISEQQAILNYLDDKCSKIDKAIDLVEKQIDAYKKLKRSLINEVVTGKRRVA